MIEKRQLLQLARASIRSTLAHQNCPPPSPDPEWQRPTALFVTLRENNRLRGCIGSTETKLTLVDAVIRHARHAAFKDPRFSPLQASELPRLRIQISLLSPLEELSCASDQILLEQLEAKRHGLLLEAAGKSSLFLPCVWDHFPDGAEFLRQLRHKGDIPEKARTSRAFRFTVRQFQENEPQENAPPGRA